MAGYVFAIGGDNNPLDVIKDCVEQGVYSTYINGLSGNPYEGTLADYLSMKPGDNIYFFSKRKYYGIGELINIGEDCKYCNYPHSTIPINHSYDEIHNELLVDYGETSFHNRWICTFKGAPFFFEEGIDTDEILTYKPDTFKMLRAFWKVSFIKLGEEENQSLKEIFLLRRYNETISRTHILLEKAETHHRISTYKLENYLINPNDVLQNCTNGNKLKHEMALESAVVYDLVKGNSDILGHWDYVSHQVVASPFKPVDYMDKIDVMAINYLPDTKIPHKYLVAELKKDVADTSTINQVLKYVDWVCSEYTYGDYEPIVAYIIAAEFSKDIDVYYSEVVHRYYTLGSHPVRNKHWDELKLIRYDYTDSKLVYTDITPNIDSQDGN